MQKKGNIHFLKNHEIDKQRWDECINNSSNGLIYAKSFYLDNMSPGWFALAGENYEWVLPVTHRRKWSISYLYQPSFTQQLGFFFKQNVSVPYQEVIKWLQNHYKFWEINWNYATDKSLVPSSIQVTATTNFILDLSKNYQDIQTNYRNDLIRNLKKSKHFNHIYKTTEDIDSCINLYRKYYGKRIAHVTMTDYNKFSNLCHFALKHEMLYGRHVLDKDGEMLAGALLLYDRRRLYNIINVTTEPGRKTHANHFLLDCIIREFSGCKLLFDFEGSDVVGVKAFYENFGIVDQPFYLLKFNMLPWPVNLFKR